MVDVFISYKRENRAYIEGMVASLRELHVDVWFDGFVEDEDEFDWEIDQNLEASKCVFVVWCQKAAKSRWVRAEARKAHQQRNLIQATLGEVDLPVPYNEEPAILFPDVQNCNLVQSPAWTQVVQAIGSSIGRDLVGYISARETPAELLSWAKANPADQLARHDNPPIARALHDLESEKRNEVRRASQKQQANMPADSASIAQRWLLGAQSAEERDALSKAYEDFKARVPGAMGGQCGHSLFGEDALRAVICGVGSGPMEARGPKPCLAVAAGGKLFIVDAGAGAADALERKGVPLSRLQAVLLTGADPVRYADLDVLWADAAPQRNNQRLPVYGPTDSHRVVQGLNEAMGVGPASGLEPWAPAPEPGKNVIVYQADGLVVSAFTTERDAYTGRVGYRFDYRGRSLVVAGDGRAEWAEAQLDADVVLHGASSDGFAQLHAVDEKKEGVFIELSQTAVHVAQARDGTLVLTYRGRNPAALAGLIHEPTSLHLANLIIAQMGIVIELSLTSRDVAMRAL